MGLHALTLLDMFNAACAAAERLGEAAAEAFRGHPDYEVITSFPGLGETGGARVLAEIGDDCSRFAESRALKAYAGSAPVTRASGRSIVITRRRIRNDRLATASWIWAYWDAGNRTGHGAHAIGGTVTGPPMHALQG